MTHRFLRFTLAGVVAFLVLVPTSGVLASEKIAEQEDLVCTTCHDKPGSKLLTDRGKFFELMGSMDGFSEVRASFEQCTACHHRKPGSKRLTRRGEKFAFVVGDMKGLLEWVKSEHPGWPEPLEETEAKAADSANGKGDASPR